MGIAFSTANTFIFGLENLLVFWIGGKLIMEGQLAGAPTLTVGMQFAFIAYKGQFTGRVSALINYAVELRMLSLHAERLADIVLEPPEKDDAPEHDLAHLAPSIELRGVSFRYAEGEPWVLKDANLKIEAGESVAITGPSGAGKTTLLKIALGLLQPNEGEVLYGGQRIQHLGLQNVRRQIGTVMQEDVLLTGSLADNIAFSTWRPTWNACRPAPPWRNCTTTSPRCPWATRPGRRPRSWPERWPEATPAAGAFALQATQGAGPDEATSHLDLGNERAVTAALSQMPLTRLIIAHRPETIAGAQRVVQVKDGQVSDVLRSVGAVA